MKSGSTYSKHYLPLLKLGYPIIIGQLGVIILGFADTLMIGHHSTSELGAASIVNNIFNLAIVFSTGYAYGLTPIVGSLFGKGKRNEIGHSLKNSLLANTLVAGLLTTLMFILYRNIDQLGQPSELMPLIKPYYLVLLSSLIFVLLFNAFKQFADGITATKTSMWILLFGNVLNIIGNYILINGKLGFPELGLLGAGISTLFSRAIMVLLFVLLFFKHPVFKEYKDGFLASSFSKPTLKKLNNLGIPVGLQMGMETASFNLSAVMMGWIGTIALASHQVMSTIGTCTFMVYYGMGAALSIRVSHFVGQEDYKSVKQVTYAGLHITLFLALCLSLLLFFLRNTIGGWFTDSSEVSKTVGLLMFPFFLYQVGDAIQITFANALRGISDVKPMMVIAFISYFLLSLPVGYLLGFIFNLGVTGIWLAFPVGLTTAGILLWIRFYKVLNYKLS